jgi:molybdenum cofactor cytidylyltransferase
MSQGAGQATCPTRQLPGEGEPVSPAAVVLAAGASTRMGRPKQLLRHHGRSFVGCAVDLARAAGCAPILVVTGAIDLTGEALDPAILVPNPDWPLGQLSSLQAGLAAAFERRPDLPALLVLTVDRPHLRPDTVTALVEAWRREPAGLWQPSLHGRRGHPVIYPAALLPALAALPPTASPRPLVTAHAALRRALVVDDPAVHDNLDHPEDLARLS